MKTTPSQSLLEMPVEAVDGVGPKLAGILVDMGIDSVGALLEHYPHRYLDLSTVISIGRLKDGGEATVVGEVKDVQTRAARRGRMKILTVTVFDGAGYLNAVWFNQAYIADKLKVGTTVALSGRAQWRFNQLQMQNPFYDVIEEEATAEPVNTGRIVPLHPATAKLSAPRLRKLIQKAVDQYADKVSEILPPSVVERYSFVDPAQAIREIHFPTTGEGLKAAKKRLIFDEFFRLQVGLVLRKKEEAGEGAGIAHQISGRLLDDFYAGLPWSLTGDQQRALREIRADMESSRSMHRLLLGEVGSGKTIVAAAAMLMAVEGGRQAALMAPTEVLAEQHYFKLRDPLEALGLRVALILGGQAAAEKIPILAAAASGEADVVIGTHALIQEKVDFARLGLIVVDEQHRFGVRQRLDLRAKGDNPDMLVLTATPIPRTLALTLYGDLDISMLAERPGGMSVGDRITTKYLTEGRREQAYKLIRREVDSGARAYIVCPLVDESDKLEVKSVMIEAAHLKEHVFPDLRVGLLHGRMASAEKESVMRAFRQGELDVLIATTVIEVGVDVPEATVMLIEHAERFGLSQLHQLRGRVGRGERRSWCLLTGDIKTPDAKARVKAIMTINDGFELAEADLAIRGEGQLFGLRQSGLPDLKLAKLTKHVKILEAARREAIALVDADPKLAKKAHRPLKAELRRRFPGDPEFLSSG